MTPLDGGNEVVLVGTLGDLGFIGYTDVTKLHPGGLGGVREGGEGWGVYKVEVPDVDETITCTTGGEDLFVGIPFGKEYVTLMLVYYTDAWTVGL